MHRKSQVELSDLHTNLCFIHRYRIVLYLYPYHTPVELAVLLFTCPYVTSLLKPALSALAGSPRLMIREHVSLLILLVIPPALPRVYIFAKKGAAVRRYASYTGSGTTTQHFTVRYRYCRHSEYEYREPAAAHACH